MTSDLYLDVVGHVERKWPSAYDSTITRACPNCGAGRMELCHNPVTGRSRKIPCVARERQGWPEAA